MLAHHAMRGCKTALAGSACRFHAGFGDPIERLRFRRRAGELALIDQDLLHRSHPEFGSTVPARVEFERSVRVAVTLRRD